MKKLIQKLNNRREVRFEMPCKDKKANQSVLDEEETDKFLLRFETVEANLKSSMTDIPIMILAIQLLNSLNVDENQRRNIVTNIKLEDNIDVYDDIKKSIRLHKGSLVEEKKKRKMMKKHYMARAYIPGIGLNLEAGKETKK